MVSKQSGISALFATFAVFMAAAGCGAEGTTVFQIDTGDTANLTQPLKFFAVDSTTGMRGEYVHATGERLAFETLHARDEDGTQRIAARLFDACNATLSYVAEGHKPDTWIARENCSTDLRPYVLLPHIARGLQTEDLPKSLARDRALLLAAIDDANRARKALERMNGGIDVYDEHHRARGGALKVNFKGYTFKHVIELWSQQYRVPVLNKVTVNHHSGTFDTVVKRPLNGEGAWLIHETGRNCNHGACPWEEEMQRYATCEDTPETHEVYALHTDCTGVWGINHVCNDDSALQINQAYGRGLGVTHCSGTRRANRPWCGVQW